MNTKVIMHMIGEGGRRTRINERKGDSPWTVRLLFGLEADARFPTRSSHHPRHRSGVARANVWLGWKFGSGMQVSFLFCYWIRMYHTYGSCLAVFFSISSPSSLPPSISSSLTVLTAHRAYLYCPLSLSKTISFTRQIWNLHWWPHLLALT